MMIFKKENTCKGNKLIVKKHKQNSLILEVIRKFSVKLKKFYQEYTKLTQLVNPTKIQI